ncbi:MAG TPA: hypothetical protein VJR48_01480 [Ktedonobacterales bacterium]|nr:hypothetical protein [Ktedonobacterales bacterium]
MATLSPPESEYDTHPIRTSAETTVEDAPTATPSATPQPPHAPRKQVVGSLILAGMMVVLFWAGFSGQVRPPVNGSWGDIYRYQCFASSFWGGEQAMKGAFAIQCADVRVTYARYPAQVLSSPLLPDTLGRWIVTHGSLATPLHTLPIEYPVLSLIPFSLPLLAPPAYYTVVFGIIMTLLTIAVYALLVRFASWNAAGFFALCMGIGAYSTGAERFDILPAGLTLAALLLAERRRWLWAYILIALGTFLKYYPIVLLLPLVAMHLRTLPGGWRERLRGIVRPLGVFAGICATLLFITALINPMILYRQVSTLARRPIEVESVSATFAWLGSLLGIPMQPFVQFGSDNVNTPLASALTLLALLALVAGLALLLFSLWRGAISARQVWLVTLLLVAVTGKVFSAQYLIWLLPFAAYVVALEGMTPLLWLAACALTTFGYPFLWRMDTGGWHAIIALRNLLMLWLALTYLPLQDIPALLRSLRAALASARTQHPVRARSG